MAAVDVAEPAAEDAPALADSSTLPVTSTLCPTCGVNFDSSASSRYCAPAPVVLGRVDDVLALDPGDVDCGPIDAFVNMNPPALALRVEPDVPLVPVVPAVPRCRHPVIVTDRADALCDARASGEPDGAGFWAITAAVTPNIRVAQAPDQIRVLIVPPARAINRVACCNCQTSPSPSAATPHVARISRQA